MKSLQHGPKASAPSVYVVFSRMLRYRMQRYLAVLPILLIFVSFLVLYNARSRYLSADKVDPNVRVAAEDAEGKTSKETSVGRTAMDELTAAARLRKRWKPQVNCTIQPVVPSWDEFFDMVDKEKPCKKMKAFGGLDNNPEKDGSKAVCMNPSVAPKPEACTVLSFGISNEWSFDDAMATWGCDVYSFDPTMEAKDHLRGTRIHFYHLGLSDRKAIITIGNKKVPVDSYRGVLKHIGLLNKTIDYLKMDIETSEIQFFKNVLDEDQDLLMNVKQIGMEIHAERSTINRDKLWAYIHRLQCLGFRKVDSQINRSEPNSYHLENGRKVSCCYELLWINEAHL